MTTAEKRRLLRERMEAYLMAPANEAVERLIRYQELLEDWNARVNLTGDAAFDALLDKHLMDSLAPLTVAGLLSGRAAVIDVGSGAGLPGIPLAILRPDLRITLLDSLKKRVAFLDAVIGALGLTNVTAVQARAEDAARNPDFREQYDIAMARAVAALPALLELLLPFVRVGGKSVCYKGPAVEEEMAAGQAAAAELGGGPPVVTDVAVPRHPEWKHCLVVSEKLRPVMERYPRKAGTPVKNPLGYQ